jgi:hypothetical protein
MLTGPYQGAKFEGQVESIRFLTPTVAFFDVAASATPMQGSPTKLRGMHVSVKQDGQWVTTVWGSWVVATVSV